jgi:hypothetical protein
MSRSFIAEVHGLSCMTASRVPVIARLLVVAAFVLLGRLAMMLGRTIMMIGGRHMVLGALVGM